MAVRIEPRPDWRPRSAQPPIRITPSPGYRPQSLHTRLLGDDDLVRAVEVQWCPVCHSDRENISERMRDGSAVWHCDVCDHEW